MRFYRRLYGLLVVDPHDQLIVFEKQWGFNAPDGKQRTVIWPGVLYTRGIAETRPALQGDLARIVRRLVDVGANALLAKVEQVAALPLTTELVAFDPSHAERGIRLVAAGVGQPVRIVDEGLDAVPIHEVLSSEVPYSSVQADFVSQVRSWSTRHPEHRAHRRTVASWFLARDQLELTDDMAEFAFLSAGDGHGYPMYWAAAMSRTRLNEVIEREIQHARYPMRQVLPYVVGAFRWDDRQNLLEPALNSFGGAAGSAERVVREDNFDRFRRTGRWAGRLRFQGRTYTFQELADDGELARELLDEVVTAEVAEEEVDRAAVHQLDILVHAQP